MAFGTPNVIHACKGLGGILRQITSRGCFSREAVVHWNITGPAGPAGPQGPAGSPDTPDQVRDKFFQGTACLGNDPSDIMVKVGPLCVDVYEASLWSSFTGGSPVAASTCNANGNDCTNIFARSVAAVTPSATITWFQAQQACANAGKRLLTNAEWQMAAAGTPDGSTASCNTNNPFPKDPTTGFFSACVSNHAVQDMVGNVWEWVADWVPLSTACPGWGSFSANIMCLAGADTTGGPGALIRGGSFVSGFGTDSDAGVFAVGGGDPPFTVGGVRPSDALFDTGFRCAR